MDSSSNFDEFSSGLCFEVKKTIVGFRLLVTIESDVEEKNYCLFVNVRNTPTVGHLCADMFSRLGANLNDYESVKFFVGESEVLSQECILVLADVKQFRVRLNQSPAPTLAGSKSSDNSSESNSECFSSSSDDINPGNGDVSASRSNPSNGNVSASRSNPDNGNVSASRSNPGNGNDSVSKSNQNNVSASKSNPGNVSTYTSQHQGENRPSRDELKGSKSKTKDSRSKKENIYSQNGVAKLLNHLKKENETNIVCDERKSSFTEFYERLNDENEIENTISQTHQITEKERKTISDHSKSGILSSETNSNFDDACTENQNSSELNESFLERGKRKRKRRHPKKKDMNKVEIHPFDMNVKHPSPSVQTASGKHTFFNDFEETEDIDDLYETNDEIRTKILRYVDEKTHDSRTSSSFYGTLTIDASSKMDFDDEVNLNRTENPRTTPVKQSATKNGHSATEYPFSVPPSRQKAEPKDDKLSTLLMMKDLKMCSQYNVQYLNQDKIYTQRRSSCESGGSVTIDISSVNSINLSPSKREHVSIKKPRSQSKEKPDCITKRKSCPSEMTNIAPKENRYQSETSTNHSSVLNIKNSSKDCEMLLQFKVVNDKIFMRSSDTEWKQLTVELAVQELTPVKKPVPGQSVVFQLLYLKNNVYPTISGLILGHVLQYDPVKKTIIVEIQSSLLEDIVSGYEGDEPILPEGMSIITGQVYELDWIAVRNPRELQ